MAGFSIDKLTLSAAAGVSLGTVAGDDTVVLF